MQRQRGELVPVAEVVSDLGGPVAAIREASPQALHHFTRFDQVNQLVSASETTPDLGFMARMMALCSLPRTNPGNRLQYKRVNGPYKLIIIAGGDCKLPTTTSRPAYATTPGRSSLAFAPVTIAALSPLPMPHPLPTRVWKASGQPPWASITSSISAMMRVGLAKGGDDLSVVVDVVLGKRAALAVLEPLLSRAVAADGGRPDFRLDTLEILFAIESRHAPANRCSEARNAPCPPGCCRCGGTPPHRPCPRFPSGAD